MAVDFDSKSTPRIKIHTHLHVCPTLQNDSEALGKREDGCWLRIWGRPQDFGPGLQAVTPFGQTMRVLPASSCLFPPASLFPNTQRTHRLEALIRVPIRVHGKFLSIGWFAESVMRRMRFQVRIWPLMICSLQRGSSTGGSAPQRDLCACTLWFYYFDQVTKWRATHFFGTSIKPFHVLMSFL